MHQLRLKKFADRRLRAGHLWIFSNELLEIPRLEAGEVVEVIDYPGQNHGVAFYNPNTLVAARLLKHSAAPDLEFFRQRLRMAEDYRRRALDEHGAYRLSFAESDYLPGLLIDRFGDYFSFEILSVGMENHKSIILEAIAMEFPDAKGIFEKNKSRWREIEGLPLREEVVFGEIPDEFEISENGVRLLVSLREGQKTGYYLDQKYNRRAAAEVSNGADVLDLFCNQGGFALTAAIYGASSVTGVDSSAPAIERARRNAEINGFDSAEFIEADVFDYIDQQISAGKKWDVVISDPPAFAKSKKHRPKAEAAYAKLNRQAMKLVKPGGWLATSSCSQHLAEDKFYDIIMKEAAKLGYGLRMAFRGGQSPDHPALVGMPETSYLKFMIFQIIKK